MPSEQPNENMDKVLKAYAKKRREDSAQIEMDIPTRNMLQAEVKRTLAEVPVPAAIKPRPRFAFWPQLIIGVASAAALAIAVLVWKLPSRNEISDAAAVPQTQVTAPSESSPAITYSAKTAPEPKDASANAASSANSFVVKNGLTTDAASPPVEVQLPTPTPTLAASKTDEAASPAVPQLQIESGKKAEVTASTAPAHQESAPAPSTAATGAIAAAAPAPQATTRSLDKIESASLNRQVFVAPKKEQIQFSQLDNRTQYRINLNSPPLPKVLTKFGFERTGTNVVVKDSDGSIYAGNAFQNAVSQNHVQSFGGGFTRSANSPANSSGDPIPDDNFAFRVSGYNRKLRQKIIFTGNVVNAVQIVSTTNAFALQNQSSNAQEQLPAQNILLNGRVQVGRSSEFNIEAAPITK